MLRRLAFAALLGAALLGASVDGPPTPGASDTSAPRVGLVGWPAAWRNGDRLTRIETCLAGSLRRHAPGVELVSQRDVRAAVYPLLQPSTEPGSEEAFGELLARADVQQRFAALGLRYIVAYAGGTKRQELKGAALCGYTGCLGYAWQDEESWLDAALWDVRSGSRVAAEDVTAAGRSTIPVYALPILISAGSLEHACDALGEKLAERIRETAAPSSGP